VPVGPKAAQPGRELERAEERVERRRDDVNDHGCGEGVDPWVAGQYLRAACDLEQPGGPGDKRDEGEGHQGTVAFSHRAGMRLVS